jgi:hypothetical protein
MSVIVRNKSDLEPTVPLVTVRLCSLLLAVFGVLGGIVALGQEGVAIGIGLIFGSIVAAALLAVIAAICDNLIEIRKKLSKDDGEGRT